MNAGSSVEEARLPSDGRIVRKCNVIASGAFSKVFRGRIEMPDSTTLDAAIKVITKKYGSRITSERMKPAETFIEPSAPTDVSDIKGNGPWAADPEEIQQEIDTLSIFQSNRYVVELIGCIEHESETWIITEFCALTLEELFPKVRNLLPKELEIGALVHLIAPVIDAVNFIHSMGYIHGDIKTPNVLISRDGIPKLADFGLCTRLDPFTGLTDYEVKGTGFHMAPEIYREEAVGPKIDAFALGIAISNLFLDIELKDMFGGGHDITGAVIGEYFHENDEATMNLARELLQGKIREGNKNRFPGWDQYCEMFCKLVEFDVESRGSLVDFAADERMLKVMKDWKMFPCNHERFSQTFMRHQEVVASVMSEQKLASSNLLEFLPDFK